MATVYVVIGSTGEYSDRQEWFVAAYTDQAMADEHARLASVAAREIFAAAEASENSWEYRDTAVNPYDVGGCSMDYTGSGALRTLAYSLAGWAVGVTAGFALLFSLLSAGAVSPDNAAAGFLLVFPASFGGGLAGLLYGAWREVPRA